MFEYAERILNNYDDQNYTHYNESYHPKRQGLAFFDKGVQPNTNPCVGSILANVSIWILRKTIMASGNYKVYGGSLGLHIKQEILSM